MNSRPLVVAAALLLGIALYLAHRSTKRDNAELNARLAQVEEQVQKVQFASAEEQLKAENVRLRAENQRLKATLAQFKGTPATEPMARVSQEQEQGNDPLAFYRRNPALMQRYFPAIYKAEMEKKQKSEEVPAPPKE